MSLWCPHQNGAVHRRLPAHLQLRRHVALSPHRGGHSLARTPRPLHCAVCGALLLAGAPKLAIACYDVACTVCSPEADVDDDSDTAGVS